MVTAGSTHSCCTGLLNVPFYVFTHTFQTKPSGLGVHFCNSYHFQMRWRWILVLDDDYRSNFHAFSLSAPFFTFLYRCEHSIVSSHPCSNILSRSIHSLLCYFATMLFSFLQVVLKMLFLWFTNGILHCKCHVLLRWWSYNQVFRQCSPCRLLAISYFGVHVSSLFKISILWIDDTRFNAYVIRCACSFLIQYHVADETVNNVWDASKFPWILDFNYQSGQKLWLTAHDFSFRYRTNNNGVFTTNVYWSLANNHFQV